MFRKLLRPFLTRIPIIFQIFMRSKILKHPIHSLHHCRRRTTTFKQRGLLNSRNRLGNGIENFRHPATPAVDRLLAVPHAEKTGFAAMLKQHRS